MGGKCIPPPPCLGLLSALPNTQCPLSAVLCVGLFCWQEWKSAMSSVTGSSHVNGHLCWEGTGCLISPPFNTCSGPGRLTSVLYIHITALPFGLQLDWSLGDMGRRSELGGTYALHSCPVVCQVIAPPHTLSGPGTVKSKCSLQSSSRVLAPLLALSVSLRLTHTSVHGPSHSP